MPSDIAALRERVEQATGPDQYLDAEIDAALFGGIAAHLCQSRTRRSYGAGYVHANDDEHKFVRDGRNVAKVTASIDAAVAFCERALPDFLRVTIGYGGGENFAYVCWREPVGTDGDWDRRTSENVHDKPPPLAIIAALLAALEAREASR